jgi:hypothetical protein
LNGTHPINRPLIKSRNSLELRYGVVLCYPDFNKLVLFHLYTDASDHQLGAVIMQDKSKTSIAFYSQNLNTVQKQYTNAERNIELLSSIETCKEYNNILFGYSIIAYTCHKTMPSMA